MISKDLCRHRAFVGAGLKVFNPFKNIVRSVNTSTTPSTTSAYTIQAPGYAVVDVFAGYKFSDNVTASLSVNNLFDAKYYERIGTTGFFNFYGAPRNVQFKIATTF